ncbi:MAG: glycosyltransferase family 87 protein, partial [Chloroflexota bacterium]
MKRKVPFSNITAEGWQNLAIFAILIFYLMQIGADLLWQNTCGHLAIDYCAFWSAGQVANHHGYSNLYDLELITKYQMPLFPRQDTFDVIPVPYLAIFILPFQLLSLLDVATGFWIWTLINLVAYVWYLRFFVKAMTSNPLSLRLTFILALSLPFFNNLYIGQVNVWFTICVGEFMRLTMSNRPFRAGVWLGGLLLKPQMLLLILPFLILYRYWKALAGLTAASSVIVGTSFALTGIEGMSSLLRLLFGYVGGLPTNGPELMMNWRMIGVNISWPLAIIGVIVTVLAICYVWWKDKGKLSRICLLATIAGTLALSWHSHVAA